MGFVIHVVPGKAEGALVPGVLGSPDNAARGHAGAKTAAASHGTWPSVATWSNGRNGGC